MTIALLALGAIALLALWGSVRYRRICRLDAQAHAATSSDLGRTRL